MAKSLNIKLTCKPGLTDTLYGKDNDYKFAQRKPVKLTVTLLSCSKRLVVDGLPFHSKHVITRQWATAHVRSRELPNDAEFLLVMQMRLAHSYL